MEVAPPVLEYPVDEAGLLGPSLEVVDYVSTAPPVTIAERLAG